MESLYLLIPLSVGLVLAVLAVFAWALKEGQFEDLDGVAERILTDNCAAVDMAQASAAERVEK